MAKFGSNTSIIFRKVAGKIRVISKHVKVDKVTGTANVFLQNKGRTIGDMMVDIRSSTANTIDTNVYPEFRNHGLSRDMFKTMAKKLSELGKKYFASGELRSSAQAKIRSKYNTHFIHQYTGRYGENTRFNVKPKDAIRAIQDGGVVQSVTKLPLEKMKTLPKGKAIYRRINGRIVRIRVK